MWITHVDILAKINQTLVDYLPQIHFSQPCFLVDNKNQIWMLINVSFALIACLQCYETTSLCVEACVQKIARICRKQIQPILNTPLLELIKDAAQTNCKNQRMLKNTSWISWHKQAWPLLTFQSKEVVVGPTGTHKATNQTNRQPVCMGVLTSDTEAKQH